MMMVVMVIVMVTGGDDGGQGGDDGAGEKNSRKEVAIDSGAEVKGSVAGRAEGQEPEVDEDGIEKREYRPEAKRGNAGRRGTARRTRRQTQWSPRRSGCIY